MEKNKKRFTFACYAILVYTAILAADLIMFLIRGNDVKALYPQMSENLVAIAYGIAVGVAAAQILMNVWLSLWGLNVIKNEKTGRGHMVLQFILAVLAFSGIYDSIKMIIDSKDIGAAVVSLVFNGVWLIILSFYDWQAMKFRRLRVEGK